MADRSFPSQHPDDGATQLSDRLPLNAGVDGAGPSLPEPSPTETALTEKLAPAQLRAVANWMRSLAHTYDHQAHPQVGHSFRAQASRLDQLARPLTPDKGTIVGTVMSHQMAYLMTATEQYLRQELNQPGEAEAPTEACSEAEFRQAYHNPNFTVLLGAERLARRFGPSDSIHQTKLKMNPLH